MSIKIVALEECPPDRMYVLGAPAKITSGIRRQPAHDGSTS